MTFLESPEYYQMANRFPSEQWAELVCERLELGLSVADFCDWIGISRNSLMKKLRL